MICDGRWKLIMCPQAGREQLFDLENDPLELRDLSVADGPTHLHQALKLQLTAWLADNNDPSGLNKP